MAAFAKLVRDKLRKLKPGQIVTEHGIEYERLDGDGRWWISVMVNRRRYHQPVGLESQGFTRTQAEELIQQLKARKHEKRHGAASRKTANITLDAAFTAYLQFLAETGGKDVAKKKQRIEAHLRPALGALPLAALTANDLRRYSTKRIAAKAKPSTVNRELAVVSHLLRVAADPDGLNLVTGVPCRVPRHKEPAGKVAYLQPDQARALLTAAAEDPSPHILAFAWIGLHTGMRYSPILALRVADIDLEGLAIWVGRDKAGERLQPMTAELATFLDQYIADRLPKDATWLFPATKSRTGHAVNVRKAWRRVVNAAGLSKVITPHALRHTMASNAAHAGIDGATLQAVGGWKSRRMVERYTHAAALQDAMAKLAGRYETGDTVTRKLHGPDDPTSTNQ
jgi:integrase/recombinase XerD